MSPRIVAPPDTGALSAVDGGEGIDEEVRVEDVQQITREGVERRAHEDNAAKSARVLALATQDPKRLGGEFVVTSGSSVARRGGRSETAAEGKADERGKSARVVGKAANGEVKKVAARRLSSWAQKFTAPR